jgi:hypothetical protein
MYLPDPLVVTCDSCHASAETYDGTHPDRALECYCCPVKHDHAGLGCRTVTITATARLSIFDVNDLMDALGGELFQVGDGIAGDVQVLLEGAESSVTVNAE